MVYLVFISKKFQWQTKFQNVIFWRAVASNTDSFKYKKQNHKMLLWQTWLIVFCWYLAYSASRYIHKTDTFNHPTLCNVIMTDVWVKIKQLTLSWSPLDDLGGMLQLKHMKIFVPAETTNLQCSSRNKYYKNKIFVTLLELFFNTEINLQHWTHST